MTSCPRFNNLIETVENLYLSRGLFFFFLIKLIQTYSKPAEWAVRYCLILTQDK